MLLLLVTVGALIQNQNYEHVGAPDNTVNTHQFIFDPNDTEGKKISKEDFKSVSGHGIVGYLCKAEDIIRGFIFT